MRRRSRPIRPAAARSRPGLAWAERVAGILDLELLVDVYHEFSKPREMLAKLREALKPSGRLILLEYRKEDPSVPIRLEHKMTVEEVRAEIEPEGFRFEKSLEMLPRQHILIFPPTTVQ